jgi:Lon protease-like protein
MRRVIADVCRRETDPAQRVLSEPFLPDDAGWVANRLCELLPLPPATRQQMMALEDPLDRLKRVAGFLAAGGSD